MSVAIQVARLRKRYGALQALDGVDLAVSAGEFFGLLGPNGAGKTTLISILAGLVRADEGSVRVMGFDVLREYRQARRALGVVPQELVFDPFFSVRETLLFQSGYFGLRKNQRWIDEIMHRLNLVDQADTNMRRLSGGMKRRVLIAQALVHRPPVIVLDEPTAGVDVELRHALWHFIRELNAAGHTIVLTTHYLEEAENLCGRLAVLKHGRLVALDTTRNLLDRFPSPRVQVKLADSGALPESLRPRLIAEDADGYCTLRLSDYADLESVLHVLRRHGCKIQEMELVQTDLEEVFVKLTGTAADAVQAAASADV